MPLPTVIMTDVVRSTHQGDSHGGAYLVDLERGTHEQVLDWNNLDIDWEGRGAGRGLRGIACHDGEVYIAASDELFVFDQSFNILRSFKNPYLHHCHEIIVDADRLYVTSTTYDSILEFHLPTQRFDRGVWLQSKTVRQGGVPQSTLVPVRFDPNKAKGPPHGDILHINGVWRQGGNTFVSALHLPVFAAIDPNLRMTVYGRLPMATHNARPYQGGMLFNSTGQDAICIADRNGNITKSYPIPMYDPAELDHADVPKDHARQGFGRGLCTTDDGVIIGGSSPSTITAYHPETAEVLARVNVTMDVRNCPHGLEIWPY